MEFYQPKENTSAAANTPTSVEFGDRLDSGDAVKVLGIVNPSTAGDGTVDEMVSCDSYYNLVLGASTLTAGLASALITFIL